MDYPAVFQARWNISRLVLCNLIAIALLGIWMWPTGHALFTRFDEWLFHLLNQPLEQNAVWLDIWTVASMRPFDAVVGLILLSLLIKGDWVFKAIPARAALFGFVAILLLLLVIRTLFSKWLDHSSLRHDSPSMVLTAPFFRLGEKLPVVNRLSVVRDS